ncbi:unnamed protein product [Closterium sp. Naga37s-1]|nr:unnamed protein product [Closterium sp. Naga37s-1]
MEAEGPFGNVGNEDSKKVPGADQRGGFGSSEKDRGKGGGVEEQACESGGARLRGVGEEERAVGRDGGREQRIVVLKVAQLVGVASLAVPIAAWTQGTSLPLGTSLAVAAVVGGAAAASACLWFYSSRYVGELALIEAPAAAADAGAASGGAFDKDGGQWCVCISTLDFWGNRENLILPLSALVPPLKGLSQQHLKAIAHHSFVPLDVPSHRQFLVSIRHGRIPNLPLLLALLKGEGDWERELHC